MVLYLYKDKRRKSINFNWGTFERKILRKNYGPVIDGKVWGMRTNEELEQLSYGEDIVSFIKYRRLIGMGHVK